MIVEKGQQNQLALQQQHQHQRLAGPQRNLLPVACSSTGNSDEDNDEENIVIDMADEDEEEEDEEPISEFAEPPDELSSIRQPNNSNHFVSAYTNNNNNNSHHHKPVSDKVDVAADDSSNQLNFNVGDLVWFDPNQMGHSIPGKVVDYYPELNLLTLEGHAQVSVQHNGANDDERYNRVLLEAEQELQLYDLSDVQQLKSVRPRQPISKQEGFSDLVDLRELSQESVIFNLKLRHKQELVYTRCGHKILISLNPFKQLCDTYNLDQVNKYDQLNSSKLSSLTKCCPNKEMANRGHCASTLIRWLLLHDGLSEQKSNNSAHQEQQEPHIFSLANEALKRLLISGQDQCFVLLGESGAGKTEASKLLVQYFATVNKSPSNLMTEQILESIQVLESFGNAKTVHNDNSSRFVKLLDIRFNLNNGFMTDAKTSDLNLLDRTRIVSQGENERNYHIFYELLAGLSANEKEKYGLQTAEKYFYLNQGHCVDLVNKEDGNDFRALLASMQVLGFNYEEQDTIFRLLASILHLGNIYFHRKVLAVRSGKLAQQKLFMAGEASPAMAGVEGVEIGSDTEVRWVSHLLQIQFDSVMRCLTVRTTESSCQNAYNDQQLVDRIVTPLNIDQALDTRDAIARTLYNCLFKWLVQRINFMINGNLQQQQQQTNNYPASKEPIYLCRTSDSLCEFQPDKLDPSRQSSLSRKLDSYRSCNTSINSNSKHEQLSQATISILDAFGFENLSENNFEQLCINYTAELLHYHTNRYLLRLEQAEYVKERLRWTPINTLTSASSNGSMQTMASSQLTSSGAAIINLISRKPLGILALLDDECNFPKATDQSFVEKCHHNHTLNENYQRARLEANNQEFGIRHFKQSSRLVWYQVDGFIEKNRDSLRPDIYELLVGSRMLIVSDMLRKLHYQEPNGSHSGAKTLSRTYDGRYVSMKPRATTLVARFQDALHNNRVLDSINYTTTNLASSSSATTTTTTNNQQLPAESAQYYSRSDTPINGNSSRPNPWFVVCLRPNKSRTEQVFDVSYMQEQLLSLGLLELAQMRKIGYPVRMRYGEFVRRYKCLVPQKFLNELASCQDVQLASHQQRLLNDSININESDEQRTRHRSSNGQMKRAIREVCSAIIEFKFKQMQTSELGLINGFKDLYQCGLTKIFLNERLYHHVEKLRLIQHQQAISMLQKSLRMWLVRRQFLRQRSAAILIQAQMRAYLARRQFWRQYMLIVGLQRRWRHQLINKRRRQLEAKRKAQRLKQQRQVQEVASQHKKLADPLRFRLQRPANPQGHAPARSVPLDIPEELAHLYRLQRDWRPVHELNQVSEISVNELLEREQRRLERRSGGAPFFAFTLDTFCQSESDQLAPGSDNKASLINKLESDERLCLQHFLLKYYTVDVPQFGYSRLPITRPFSWQQMARRRHKTLKHNQEQSQEVNRRYNSAELKAIAIFKLILRYIDSDLDLQSQTSEFEQTQKVSKFKLIADYVIYLCIKEPLLRDEIYLQLASQSWQNPKPKSSENVWKLMLNCLCCFKPLDKQLSRFLLRYAIDYCCPKYRKLAVEKLADLLVSKRLVSRQYPPTLLEYWANQQAIGQLALPATCYMDEQALNCAQTDPAPSSLDMSAINFSNKTIVQVNARTRAEDLAAAALLARNVPEANLSGWSVEIQHEGAQSELSARLRGDDYLLDHLSLVELLPDFEQLIEEQRDLEADNPARVRRDSLSAISTPINQRYSLASQRSSDLGGARRNSYALEPLEIERSVGSRLSQTSKLNRRYIRPDSAAFDEDLQSQFQFQKRQFEAEPPSQLNRRSMSMQELQLASSALNGRYFRPPQQVSAGIGQPSGSSTASSHYAASCVSPQARAAAGSLQQLAQWPQPQVGRRRSQTPNSMCSPMANNRASSSSAYGSEFTQQSYLAPMFEPHRRSRVEATAAASRQFGRPRRSASSSSRAPRRLPDNAGSDYASAYSDYERIGPRPSKPAAPSGQYKQPTAVSGAQQRRPAGQSAALARRAPAGNSPAPASGPPHELPHYAASSALSDTSEAPSLASHVRGIKVPQHNADLDKYLDDLFNPMLDEAELDELSDARSLATSIRGTEPEAQGGVARDSKAPLSPTFESLLQSLQSAASQSASTSAVSGEQANLSSLNLNELKALNEKLELQIQVAQQQSGASISELTAPPSSEVPVPPPQPSFGAQLDDLYSRARTIRIGKWRWPPEQAECSGPEKSTRSEEEGGKEAAPAQEQSEPVEAEAEAEQPKVRQESGAKEQQASPSPHVGRLKISSEMKAKLEQLTTGSGTAESGATPTQARPTPGDGSAVGYDSSRRISSESAGSKVLAVKQQLAAAAGVALAALDSGGVSGASSRRQSCDRSAAVKPEAQQADRHSRVLQDELGPQTRAAISQRQAFYQMSASSDHIDHLDHAATPLGGGQTAGEHCGSEAQLREPLPEHIPPPCAVSSDNLVGGAELRPQPALTRAMQMAANLNEAGQSSAVGKESDRIYGQSIAKSLSQRQHENLKADKRTQPRPPFAEQWVSSSPDRSLARVVKRTSTEPEQASKRRGSSRGVAGGGRRAEKAVRRAEEEESDVCLAYANIDWQIKIRKEFFLPSETYDDPLVVQLIFAQLVADVFNPRHWTRLNNKERAAIKALMKDNSIGYAPTLPQIGHMQAVKRELVRMARSFGLYFTRSYPATNFALAAATPLRAGAGNSAGESEEEEAAAAGCEQAVKLMHRLRNAGNLGADWLDMVAVHHSGLRLVALVGGAERTTPRAAPATPTPAPGYRVLETLKYRDMTDVSQIGPSELLVSMRNGKKCWLISSVQAAQLGSQLRCFHADYNDQLAASNKLAAEQHQHQNQYQQQQVASKISSAQQHKHKLSATSKDALLAPDDGHHGDHIKQRQASNGINRLHKKTHPDDDLVNGERVLPGDLAHSNQTLQQHRQQQQQPVTQQQQPKQLSSPPHLNQRKLSSPQPPPAAAQSTGGARSSTERLRPTGVALEPANTISSNKSQAKKTNWQNSLSRMSSKFNIFAASQSRASSKQLQLDCNKVQQHPPSSDAQQVDSAQQEEQTQVALDAWIETKVDFEAEDEGSSLNLEQQDGKQQPLEHSTGKPDSLEPKEDPQADERLERDSTRSKLSQRRSSANQQQPVDGAPSKPEASPEADGKHSLLQFALYNFREAIDKYSLESRASKTLNAGDTSTLRGSLKLIETLRSSRGSDANQSQISNGKRLLSAANGSILASQQQQQTSNEWTWRELAEMVKFTRTPLRQSLLKLPSEDLNKRALDCFAAVMQYMGDLEPSSGNKQQVAQADEVECVYLILMNCHNFPILRDEIYCQLMKQTTNNRSAQPDSCLRGWRLFSIVAAYFDCSHYFKPYLLKYLETAAFDKRRAYCSVASLCLQNLRKTFKYNGRKNVPSIEEIAATSAGRNSKRQIYRLPGGTERVINTKSTTVVEDIIHEICTNMLNVVDSDEMLEFSLYCIADGDLYTMPLNRDEYILDVTTELTKNHQQYFLIFCRSIWYYPLRLDSKLYIEVIFNQIAPDYLEGLLLVLPSLKSLRSSSSEPKQPLRLKSKLVRDIARIAALLHRASGTDYMPHKDEVKYLLPKPIISAMKQQQRAINNAPHSDHSVTGSSAGSSSGSARASGSLERARRLSQQSDGSEQSADTIITTPQKWIELVQSNWREMSAFDTLDAKAQFLDIVRHWPLFGSSFFAIKFILRDLIQPMDYILALNKLGIQMLDMATHETIHKYPFNEVISTRKVRSEDGALFLDLKCGNLMKRTIIRIQTDQAHEISRLIRQYIDIELLQQRQEQQQQQQQITSAAFANQCESITMNRASESESS